MLKSAWAASSTVWGIFAEGFIFLTAFCRTARQKPPDLEANWSWSLSLWAVPLLLRDNPEESACPPRSGSPPCCKWLTNVVRALDCSRTAEASTEPGSSISSACSWTFSCESNPFLAGMARRCSCWRHSCTDWDLTWPHWRHRCIHKELLPHLLLVFLKG